MIHIHIQWHKAHPLAGISSLSTRELSWRFKMRKKYAGEHFSLTCIIQNTFCINSSAVYVNSLLYWSNILSGRYAKQRWITSSTWIIHLCCWCWLWSLEWWCLWWCRVLTRFKRYHSHGQGIRWTVHRCVLWTRQARPRHHLRYKTVHLNVHVTGPVLASTSRTHSPVITSVHLYWLQHQELTRLWSHQYTCTGFNTKNSLTCDHINTPVLASTSKMRSSVIFTTTNRRWLHLSQTACSTRLIPFHTLNLVLLAFTKVTVNHCCLVGKYKAKNC